MGCAGLQEKKGIRHFLENIANKGCSPRQRVISDKGEDSITKLNVRLSKKGIEELPDNKPGVYIIKNNNGTNMFTGIAKRGQVHETLKSHFYGGDNYIPGARVNFEQFNNLTEANAQLKSILEKDKPSYN